MSPEDTLNILNNALWMTIMLSAPLLLAILAIGVLIGMLQAATQINEMTLSFIPKLIVLFFMLLIAGPWILQTLISYTEQIISSIPSLIG